MNQLTLRKVRAADSGATSGRYMPSRSQTAVYGLFVDDVLRALVWGEREFRATTWWHVELPTGLRFSLGLGPFPTLSEIRDKINAQPQDVIARIERAESYKQR